MVFKDLIAQANRLVDDVFDNKSWEDWINDGLDDLSEALLLETSAILTCEIDKPGVFKLPLNFKSETAVIDDVNGMVYNPIDLIDFTSWGYHISEGYLSIQGGSPATIKICYIKYPAHVSVSDTSKEIDIPDIFSEALILYGCMRAMQSDDEPERYQQFKADYFNAKTSAVRISARTKPRRIGAWKVVR